MFKRISDFFQEVVLELKKVVFPTKKEVIGSTWVVIITVLICAFFLGIIDVAVTKAMSVVIFK